MYHISRTATSRTLLLLLVATVQSFFAADGGPGFGGTAALPAWPIIRPSAGFSPYPTFIQGQSPRHSAQQDEAQCSPAGTCSSSAATQLDVTSEAPMSEAQEHQQRQQEPLQALSPAAAPPAFAQTQQQPVPQPVAFAASEAPLQQLQQQNLSPLQQPTDSNQLLQHQVQQQQQQPTVAGATAAAAQPVAHEAATPAPVAQTPLPAPASGPAKPRPHHPAPVRRLLNLADLSDGASVLAANPEVKRPERAIDKDIDSFMKNDCNADKWMIIELSQLGTVETVKLTMKELYSSRVHTFRVFGRSSHPRKDGPDLTASLTSDAWQLLGSFTAENKRGTQAFSLPQRSRVRYLLLKFDSHYGNEAMCAMNWIEVLGVSAAQELEEALALQELEGEGDEHDQQLLLLHLQDQQQQQQVVQPAAVAPGTAEASLAAQPDNASMQASVQAAVNAGAAVTAAAQQQQQQTLPSGNAGQLQDLQQQQQQQPAGDAPGARTVQQTQPQYEQGAAAGTEEQGAAPATGAAATEGVAAGGVTGTAGTADEAGQTAVAAKSTSSSSSSSSGPNAPATQLQQQQPQQQQAGSGAGTADVTQQQQLPAAPVAAAASSAGSQDEGQKVDTAAAAAAVSVAAGLNASAAPADRSAGAGAVGASSAATVTEGSGAANASAPTAAVVDVVVPVGDSAAEGKAAAGDGSGQTAQQQGVGTSSASTSSSSSSSSSTAPAAEHVAGAPVVSGSRDAAGAGAASTAGLTASAELAGAASVDAAALAGPFAASPSGTAAPAAAGQQSPAAAAGIPQQQQQQREGSSVLESWSSTAKPKQAGNLFDVIKSEMMQLKLDQGKVAKKLDSLGKRSTDFEALAAALQQQQTQLMAQLEQLSTRLEDIAARQAKAEVINHYNTHHHHHHHQTSRPGAAAPGGFHPPHQHSNIPAPHMPHSSVPPGGQTPHMGPSSMPVCMNHYFAQALALMQPQYQWAVIAALSLTALLGLCLVLHPRWCHVPQYARVVVCALALLNGSLAVLLSCWWVVLQGSLMVQGLHVHPTGAQLVVPALMLSNGSH